MDNDALIESARNVPIEDEIIRRGIKLRRSGAERVGPCPECGGTDRFAINVSKGIFNCRGCGAKGDVIELVEFLDKVDFKTAVETLAGTPLRPKPNGNAGHPPRSKPQLGPIVATYDYEDEGGELLFQVTRHEPKDFRQRKPDGNGAWIANTDGVRMVPYHLPELAEAIGMELMIFIVEGEKDADNIIKLGAPSTCNPRGAGKWAACKIDSHFADAHVVIVADNDPQTKNKKTGALLTHEDGRPRYAGWDHAVEVAQHLREVAASVRVIDLKKIWPQCPDKGDISNWIDSGGTIEALNTIVDNTEEWDGNVAREPPAPKLLPLIDIRLWHGTEPEPQSWLVPGCIPDNNVSLLTGQGGVGKTMIMQQLSVATVLGKDWFGLLPDFGPVLFITAEDDEKTLHFRYHAIAKAYDTTFNDLADQGLHLLSLAGKDAAMGIADNRGIVQPTELWRTVVRTAQTLRPRWIGLDTAADIFLVNERDRAEVRQCITLLRGLALDINTCVILLAHPSLTGISSGSGLSGSTAWHNSVRSRLYLKTETSKKKKDDDVDEGDEPAPDLAGTRILSFMKSNYSALAKDIRIEWKNGLFHKEPGIRGMSEPDKASLDKRAQQAFCEILKRMNSQNIAASPKERANNYVVTQMLDAPEVKALHEKKEVRRQLLVKALKVLLASGDLFVKPGPEGFPASKQRECLYLGKRLF